MKNKFDGKVFILVLLWIVGFILYPVFSLGETVNLPIKEKVNVEGGCPDCNGRGKPAP